MLTTIALREMNCGTELNIVQEEIPNMIPIEHCYLGWQQSFNLLLFWLTQKSQMIFSNLIRFYAIRFYALNGAKVFLHASEYRL